VGTGARNKLFYLGEGTVSESDGGESEISAAVRGKGRTGKQSRKEKGRDQP